MYEYFKNEVDIYSFKKRSQTVNFVYICQTKIIEIKSK